MYWTLVKGFLRADKSILISYNMVLICLKYIFVYGEQFRTKSHSNVYVKLSHNAMQLNR